LSGNYQILTEKLQKAIALLGIQAWESAYKDSEGMEYRILRLDGIAMKLEHKIQAALDTLTTNHSQKPMTPFKHADKSEYTPVIKVFGWRSIDNIIRKAKNPSTTVVEIEEAVKRTADMTCFESVFPNNDDFLAFQAMFDSDDIRDLVNGGLILRMEVDNATIEGVQEILKRSGLDINQIKFSYQDGPETYSFPTKHFQKRPSRHHP
jgi:hypothetical protein